MEATLGFRALGAGFREWKRDGNSEILGGYLGATMGSSPTAMRIMVHGFFGVRGLEHRVESVTV